MPIWLMNLTWLESKVLSLKKCPTLFEIRHWGRKIFFNSLKPKTWASSQATVIMSFDFFLTWSFWRYMTSRKLWGDNDKLIIWKCWKWQASTSFSREVFGHISHCCPYMQLPKIFQLFQISWVSQLSYYIISTTSDIPTI